MGYSLPSPITIILYLRSTTPVLEPDRPVLLDCARESRRLLFLAWAIIFDAEVELEVGAVDLECRLVVALVLVLVLVIALVIEILRVFVVLLLAFIFKLSMEAMGGCGGSTDADIGAMGMG